LAYPDEVLADNPRWWWRLAAIPGGMDLSAGSTRETITPGGSLFGNWRGICTDGYAVVASSTNGGLADATTRLYVASGFSFECWFWPIQLPTGTTVLYTNIPGGLNAGNGLNFQADGKLHVYIWNGTTLVDTASVGSPSNNQWHHVVVTLGAGDIRLYIDGALDKVIVQTQSGTNPAQPLTLMNNVARTNGLPMMFAEPAIYPSVLSASRVLAHYNAANLKAFDPIYQPASQSVQITQIVNDTTALLDDLATVIAAVQKTYS